MSDSHHDRLSALDAAFLQVEDEVCPMHVGAVAVFDPGPLSLPDGGFDIERFSRFVETTLLPRYRQRIEQVPITNHPVWVDDSHFSLGYHLRHVRLPRPGGERLLKRLAGHVMSLALDRGKPLWELWVVEGLAQGRFAVIMKGHHCMMDGVGTADLLTASMQLTPDAHIDEPRAWRPRPTPSPAELLVGDLQHRIGEGFDVLRSVASSVARPRQAFDSLMGALEGVAEFMGASLHQSSPTPLNLEIGPHRRFDWTRYDLAAVKQVKNRLGGTVNDVVLANVAGALRRFLIHRGEDVDALDFRAMVPVNIRTGAESGTFGNRVATLVAALPLDEPDPRRRLDRVIGTTRELKGSRQRQGMETLEEIGELGLGPLFVRLARLTALSQPFNVVVTNVPGPQVTAYLLGAPLREVYPLVPLYRNQALGIALFSYDGGLFWGLNADWDAVPDLHLLVGSLQSDFEELVAAAA